MSTWAGQLLSCLRAARRPCSLSYAAHGCRGVEQPTFAPHSPWHRHRGCSWCGQPAGWVPAGHLPPPPPASGWLPGDASNLRVPATYKWARPTDTHTCLCHVLTCCHRARPCGVPHPMMRPVAEGSCTPTAAVRTRFCTEENGRAPRYCSGRLLVCPEPPTSQAEKSAETGLWSRNWAADAAALPRGLHPAAPSGTHRPRHWGRPLRQPAGQRSPVGPARVKVRGPHVGSPPWSPGARSHTHRSRSSQGGQEGTHQA